MPLARVVVPVELALLLALGELVRAVAVRLVLRQPAFAKPGFLAFDHVAGGLLGCSLYETGHVRLRLNFRAANRIDDVTFRRTRWLRIPQVPPPMPRSPKRCCVVRSGQCRSSRS